MPTVFLVYVHAELDSLTGARTATIRLHDGSYRDIAIVQGTVDYVALMLKLATRPINREPDHYDTAWEKWQYLRSRAQRLANKLIGRPATEETAILTSMVAQLLQATRQRLGDNYAVAAAVLNSPDRVRLTDEETGDIFDYLKLRNLVVWPPTLHRLYSTSAAYAGYGKGLS